MRWAQPDKRTAEAADDDDEGGREQLSRSGSAAASGQVTKYPGEAEEEFPLPSRDDSLLASPAGAADAEETEPPPLAGMALLAADLAWARSAATHWASFSAKRAAASTTETQLNP